MALQETKQRATQRDIICPRAYKSYAKPFTGGEIASGGVGLLINIDLIQAEIPLDTPLEAVAARVTLHGKPMSVISLYLHPESHPTLGELNNLLTQVPPPCVILGDLNAHNPIWGGTVRDRRGTLIEEFTRVNNLVIFNDRRSTWECATSGRSSSIDLTIGHPSLRISFDWDVLDDNCGSDHFPTELTHLSKRNGCDPRPQHWVMGRANIDLFKAKCEQEITREILETEDVMSTFTKKLREIALVCIPKSSANPKNPPVPWFDDECTDANKAKKRAQNRAQSNRTLRRVEEAKLEERNCKNLFNKKRRESWQSFVSGLSERVSSKIVWDMVRKISGKNIMSPIKPLKLENGRLVETRQEICEEIAKTIQFHSSTENLPPGFAKIKEQRERTPIQIDLNSDGTEFYNRDFTMREFDHACNQAGNGGVGPDDSHYQQIRDLPKATKEIVLEGMNKMYKTRTFPEEWREAFVIPIPKPDKDHSNPANFRPISLTSCLCKIMERMINNRLTWFLETNGLTSRWQSGARSNRTTTDQLVRLECYIREAWARKEHVVSVFFDIEKAYDTAWKYGVLSDLHKKGLRGNLLAFISNYLTDRKFRIRLGACLSESKDQEEGFPQGGVLSVTLFKIRIDPLADEIPPGIMKSLFVDDLNINKSGRNLNSVVRAIQIAVNKVFNWCTANGFKVALVKTKCIHFTLLRENADIIITIGNNLTGVHTIQVVDSTKFLGLIFDRKLTFKKHIEDLKARCNNAINLLKVVSHKKWGADRGTKLKLWRALTRTKLEHGSILFNSVAKTHLHKLEAVQTVALRICLGAFCTTPATSLQVEANELPIRIRFLQLAMNYALTVKANPENPANEALFKDYSDVVRSNCIPPCGYFLQGDLRRAQINVDLIKPLIHPNMPPAMLEGRNINTELTSNHKEHTLPQVFTNMFLEIRDSKYSNATHIYTDGSKKDDKTAAAMVVPQQDHTEAFRLPDGSSIFTAESSAISQALQYVQSNPDISEAAIFSDSLSCLEALLGLQTRNPLTTEILNLLHFIQSIPKTVHLCWIPGHVGIRGNEAADKAAKDALEISEDDIRVTKIPHSDFRPFVRKYCYDLWQTWWDRGASSMYPTHPVLPYKFTTACLTRNEEWVYTRAHIGHTRLTHGHRLNPGETAPECEDCEEPLTMNHILIECPALDEIREEFYQDTVSVQQLFSEVHPRHVLDFLREIGLFHDI